MGSIDRLQVLAGRTICVVDDSPDDRWAAKRALAGTECSLLEYSDARSFLADVPRLAGACVMLDVRMPGMNGLDVLAALPPPRPIAILVVTGEGGLSTAVEAMKLGAHDFIEKPYATATVVPAICRAITWLDENLHMAEAIDDARRRLSLLSGREGEVLEALTRGLQSKVIAYELSISARTVEVYRTKLLDRLGVRTLSEALHLRFTALLQTQPRVPVSKA